MTLWLETIRFELDALERDGSFEPLEPVHEQDEVIGEVSDDDVRQLYRLSRRYAYLFEHDKLEASVRSRGPLPVASIQLDYRSRILAMAFWDACRSTLDDYGPEELGVRAGWQLVRTLQTSPFGAFFGGLGQ